MKVTLLKKKLVVYEIHRHEYLMILHIFAPLLSHYFALTDLAGLYLVSNRCSFDVQLNYVFMIEVKGLKIICVYHKVFRIQTTCRLKLDRFFYVMKARFCYNVFEK